jgi:uncharacterized membrane protein
METRNSLVLAVLTGALLVPTGGLRAQSYSNIACPDAVVRITGIDSLGDKIVGYCSQSSGDSSGFVYKNDHFTAIEYPGSSNMNVNGVNFTGDMVGMYVDSIGGQHAFLLQSGSYSTIDPPGSSWAVAWGINDNGDIVGISGGDAPGTGFLLSKGAYASVAYPGAYQTIPYGINAAGDIVGIYYPQNLPYPIYGFLLHNGTYTDISVPGATDTEVRGINGGGDMVGWSNAGFGAGFLLTQGSFTNAGPFKGRGAQVIGIDDSGDMVGMYDYSPFGMVGFLFSNSLAAPVAPANFVAGQFEGNPQNVINLYWQASPNNESGFQIFRSQDGGVTFAPLATVGPNTTFYQDQGLTAFTAYYYYVAAFNSAGSTPSNTDWAITAFGTNPDGPPPAVPSQLVAGRDQGNGLQIDVYWQGDTYNDIGYQVFRSLDGVRFHQIATVPSAAAIYPGYMAFRDGGLSPATIYYYCVKAYNKAGVSAASNIDWTVTSY